MSSLISDILFACRRKCPVCHKGDVFDSWLNFTPVEHCAACGAALKESDVGDGAIVFLIFILGFTIIPAAVIWEFQTTPPVWLQGIVWSVVGVCAIFILTPIIKSFILLLQFRHRK